MSHNLKSIFGLNSTPTFKPSNKLVMPTLMVGVEIEVEGWNGVHEILNNGSPTSWQSKEDHSLHKNGREFVCGPITGQELITNIEAFCRHATKNNFSRSIRTAIHVHLDCTHDKTNTFIGHLVATYMAVEHALYSYCGQWRKYCGFCNTLADAEAPLESIRGLVKAKKSLEVVRIIKGLGRYSGLNLASLAKFGTVEFRMLPTTYASDEVVMWINIVESIYRYAEWLEQNETTVQQQYKQLGANGLFGAIFSSHDTYKAIAPHLSEKEFKNILFRIRTLGLDPFEPSVPLCTEYTETDIPKSWDFDPEKLTRGTMPIKKEVSNPLLEKLQKANLAKPEPVSKTHDLLDVYSGMIKKKSSKLTYPSVF